MTESPSNDPLYEAWLLARGPLDLDEPHWYGSLGFGRNAPLDDLIKAYRLLLPDTPRSERERAVQTLLDDTKLDTKTLQILLPHSLRDVATHRYSFAVTSPELMSFIGQLNAPILDVMAGTGWWVHQLNLHGITAVGCDVRPPDGHRYDEGDPRFNHWFDGATPWAPVFRVEALDALVDAPPEWVPLLCWPPYGDDVAARCLDVTTADRVLYIGEGVGGCTADDRFFTMIGQSCCCYGEDAESCPHTDPPTWHIADECYVPQWSGIHDRLFLLERGS